MEDYITCHSDLSSLKRTPSAFLGSCRYKLPAVEDNEELYERIFEILEKYNIEFFLYIGGNDSMDTIKMLSDYAAMHDKPRKIHGCSKDHRQRSAIDRSYPWLWLRSKIYCYRHEGNHP